MNTASEKFPTQFNIDFMVPGFSKCGTTTLCSLLDEHPDICLATTKEPNFFYRDDYQQHWDYYKNLFPRASHRTLFGEGSTTYSAFQREQTVRDRILEYFPEIKMIFIARDPLQRIESSFREFHHSGYQFDVHVDFDANNALAQIPALLNDSLYYRRLQNYAQRIPAQRILIVFLEDLVADPATELRRCFNFLGVDPAPADSIPLRVTNAGEQKLRDSKLLRYLRHSPLFWKPIAKLSAMPNQPLFSRLGLRKPFVEKIRWRAAALQTIADTLSEDTQCFLQYAGKNLDFWPAFADIAKTYRRH